MQEGRWLLDLASALTRTVQAKNELAARKAASAFQPPADVGVQDVLREAQTLYPSMLATLTVDDNTPVHDLMEEIASRVFLGEEGDYTLREDDDDEDENEDDENEDEDEEDDDDEEEKIPEPKKRKHDDDNGAQQLDERAVLTMAIPHIRALRAARPCQPLSDEHREHICQLNKIGAS